MNQRIDVEKARGTKLKQKVQLHVSLNTEDQVRKHNVFDNKIWQQHPKVALVVLSSRYLVSLSLLLFIFPSSLVHPTPSSCSQDVMLDTLGEKVAEVHRCCVDDRMTNLSTLEKLANIENRMSLLLQGLESIPAESLVMMKRIKDSERRSRYVSVTVLTFSWLQEK